MSKLDIPTIFKSEADDLIKCREDALRVHGTDIRSAGNEVEICVRNYFQRMLPSRYYITHGHLIDPNSNVSPQLDIIIADNSNIPSLMTTKDGTEYIPIDSVYAVGEIKSTYYKSKNPIASFSTIIREIRENLHHKEILNTAHNSVKEDTLIRDIVLAKRNRILNRIFYFIIFVDGGDFVFEQEKLHYLTRDNKYLPNLSILLNKGIVSRASYKDETFNINYFPEDITRDEEDWYFYPLLGLEDDNGSLEGNHLGFLYYSLVEHLANSYLEPPSLQSYLVRLMIGRKHMWKKGKAT